MQHRLKNLTSSADAALGTSFWINMPTEAKLGLVVGIILTIVMAICFKPSETTAAKPAPTFSTPANAAVQGQTTGLRR